MSSEGSRKVTVALPAGLLEAAEARADQDDRRLNDVIRDALARYLGHGGWKSVGEATRDALRAGLTNQEALDAVRAEVPGGTTMDSVRWYRSKMRREGEDIPKDAEIKTRRKQGAG